MPEKRKDSKGRNLRQGELQRNDGKYEYRYIDSKGVKHSVYSWQLVDSDKIPAGKRSKESLRAMEKRIARDQDDGIDTYGASRTTLNAYYDDYITSKRELKPVSKITTLWPFFWACSMAAFAILTGLWFSPIEKTSTCCFCPFT